MRSSTSLALVASATLFASSALVVGCGDDDPPSQSTPTGGSSSGATSGTSGTSGTSTGGMAGSSATGGTSGSSGSSATSGTGGTTGGTGSGGDSGGGAGGEVGPGGGGMGGGGGEAGNPLLPLFERLSPLPAAPPADPTNQYADSALARTLGQRFFFDKAFSGALAVASDLGTVGQTGKVSCATCHSGQFMEDDHANPPQVSIGTGTHARNAPALVNSAFYVWTNWAGRFSAPWELPIPVTENPVIMNGTRLAVAHRIASRYKAGYEAIFGTLDTELGTTTSTRFPASGKPNATSPGVWEAMAAGDQTIVNRVYVNFGKALEAYMRQLVSRNSPFDQWVDGGALASDPVVNASAQRGAALFVGKARCNGCHANTHFSDDLFHNLGVPQGIPLNPDQGRFADGASLLGSGMSSSSPTWSDNPNTGRLAGLTNPMPESARGAFRTPDLRGVAETAPYMHSGQLATLEAVVEFYDQGGGTPVVGTRDALIQPLGLTSGEKADLVAFLRTLSGAPVPAPLLVDTSAAP